MIRDVIVIWCLALLFSYAVWLLPFCVEFILSRYSGIIPSPIHRVRVISESKLATGVNGCLSPYLSPVTEW